MIMKKHEGETTKLIRFDPATGTLTPFREVSVPPPAQLSEIAFSKDGRSFAYGVNDASTTLYVMTGVR